ncbi:hypothetical protein SUGI_0125470 [Cryptomeria japonica]|nr:hypothetical protein SUGI_0125470 [Cryptomeria japonica]
MRPSNRSLERFRTHIRRLTLDSPGPKDGQTLCIFNGCDRTVLGKTDGWQRFESSRIAVSFSDLIFLEARLLFLPLSHIALLPTVGRDFSVRENE